MERCLAGYRFNEAANSIYEFIWHEFCDWYIEIAKPVIGEESSQTILYKVLEKSLRMLHPFMPFITEEIWCKLAGSKDSSIMIQPWPHIQKGMISARAEAEMASIIALVTGIRNMRSAWNIEPAREVNILINMHDASNKKTVSDNIAILKKLARLSSIETGALSKPKGAAVSVIGKDEIYLPLEGLIDLGKELERIRKEALRIETEMDAITRRLSDKEFVSKAPAEVVEKQRSRN